MGIFTKIMRLFSNAAPETVKSEDQDMKPLPTRPNIVPKTAKEARKSHNEYMDNMMTEASDVVDGVTFAATLQLRTPLWILQKDGEKWSKGEPPEVGEPWMGIWVPRVRSWKELGIDNMPEFPESSHASDIGPVMHSEYLPFLIDIRKAVEADESIKARIELLRQVAREKKYAKFIKQHGGQNKIIDYFFPPLLETIPGINSTVSDALREMKITTIRKLRKTTDKDLLSIKGVGSVAVKKLRDFSDNYTGDDNLDRVDVSVR